MDKTFKVIIAGSREFADFKLLCKTMDHMLSKKLSEGYSIQVISGASRGADKLGEQYAGLRGYEVISMPADWDSYGKRAGYLRNEEMANIADALVAFHNGVSPGTKHMIDIAKKKGLPNRVVEFTHEHLEEEKPQIVGFFDGSSVNESGKWTGGIGAVAYEGENKIVEISECIGEATNNVAEYTALIRLLEELLLYSNAVTIIKGDSQLVINQVNGLWECRNKNLIELLSHVNELKRAFRNLSFEWVDRKQNSEADALSGKSTRNGGGVLVWKQ